MRTRRTALLLFVVALPLVLSGQAEFDVASIKENKTPGDGGSLRLMPSGGDTFYDIDANPAEKATRDQTFVMLQGLLADRFTLTFHREMRQVDGYTLVRMRPDALGPSLRPSAFDCEKQMQTTPQAIADVFVVDRLEKPTAD